MKPYQAIALRAVAKVLLIVAAMVAVLVAVTLHPEWAAALGRRGEVLPWVLWIMIPMCVAFSLWMLFTTPAQNERATRRMMRWGAKPAQPIDFAVFQPDSPDYHVTTLRWWLRGRGGG